MLCNDTLTVLMYILKCIKYLNFLYYHIQSPDTTGMLHLFWIVFYDNLPISSQN